jgi:hypothetical protein
MNLEQAGGSGDGVASTSRWQYAEGGPERRVFVLRGAEEDLDGERHERMVRGIGSRRMGAGLKEEESEEGNGLEGG